MTTNDRPLSAWKWKRRDNADYNLFYEANEEKVFPYIEPARRFVEKIEKYINREEEK